MKTRKTLNTKVLLLLSLLIGSLISTDARTADVGFREPYDYLTIVKAYSDAMIRHGRDTYGQEHSPLFAEELDRKTMRMLEGESLKNAAAITREEWGIRSHDRMLGGSNPQHCQNLYQILYQLTEITGQKRYAEEADRSLQYFFETCQSPSTGLFWWGEHAGWDLRTDKPLDKSAGNTHEFYRPWILWQRSWRLADKACGRFALGLWEHQIGDHKTGDFSRHASIASHGPGTEAPYARHGGFYIETWATAYEQTKDKLFLVAIESVLDGLERARLQEGGMVTGGSKKKGSRAPYAVSLAISLEQAARRVPSELAKKMRNVASANDKAFAKAHPQTNRNSANWSNAYGSGGPAAGANTCMLRYRQVHLDTYRRFVLQTADGYREVDVDLSKPVWPGTLGNVVLLMLNAYELTSNDKYLQAADRFARKSVELFLSDGCPLPKASHMHDHYEVVTNGDTLMMSLLRLWLIQNRPESKAVLIFTDR
ncbi:MAG: hypothetical protein JXM79_02610 [Sedimentisphaerales bacterium]|nr:hypothetical protein [Sedimentisphaerales bacterium]